MTSYVVDQVLRAKPRLGRQSSRLDAVLRAGHAHAIATVGADDQEEMPQWLQEAGDYIEQTNVEPPVLRARRIRTLEAQVRTLGEKMRSMQRECEKALAKAEDEREAMIDRSAKRQQELLMEMQDLENRLVLSGKEYDNVTRAERQRLQRENSQCQKRMGACTLKVSEAETTLQQYKAATADLAKRIRDDEGAKIDRLEAREKQLKRQAAELEEMVEQQESFVHSMFPSREE
jgi:hypothetical protein